MRRLAGNEAIREEGVHLERYTPSRARNWNEFVASARNGVFLFHRDYMDYHADRFSDHSLLVYQAGRLLAVLPANEHEGTLFSHGGLTFGGFISGARMSVAMMLDTFAALIDYGRERGLERLIYKPVPHIYHRVPAEEDLYALFRCGARLTGRSASSTIDLAGRLRPTKGRKWGASKARRHGLVVRRSAEIERFMEIEETQLRTKYGLKPTHTAAEMGLLTERFPENIHLYAAYEGSVMLGGSIVYESENVAHAQYIATSARGRDVAALDAVLDHLLNEVYATKRYFDFGISTEDEGRHLNLGLVTNKESYGGRGIVYDSYDLNFGSAAVEG